MSGYRRAGVREAVLVTLGLVVVASVLYAGLAWIAWHP
jgi:hypothetical protein